MKQRFISVLVVTALFFVLISQGVPLVRAYSLTDIAYPVEGGNIYFNKETGAITDSDPSITRADIPAEIKGVPVTSIAMHAFLFRTNLTNVSIPTSVMSIGRAC